MSGKERGKRRTTSAIRPLIALFHSLSLSRVCVFVSVSFLSLIINSKAIYGALTCNKSSSSHIMLKPPAQPPQQTCVDFRWSLFIISSSAELLLHLQLRGFARDAATFPSLSSTASAVREPAARARIAIREFKAVRAEICLSTFFFFLPHWWRQKPNWHGWDMSVHPRQTCIRLTCHYLPSFPVWPAIIPSQLRLPRDEHGARSTEPGLICSYPLHKRKQLCHRDCANCIPRRAPSDGALIPQSESTSFWMWLIDLIIRHYEKCKLRKWLNSASF